MHRRHPQSPSTDLAIDPNATLTKTKAIASYVLDLFPAEKNTFVGRMRALAIARSQFRMNHSGKLPAFFPIDFHPKAIRVIRDSHKTAGAQVFSLFLGGYWKFVGHFYSPFSLNVTPRPRLLTLQPAQQTHITLENFRSVEERK
jgi:hypothetical protein